MSFGIHHKPPPPPLPPHTSRVFVYGTLMRGGPNHRLLEHATFLGEGELHGRYRMVSLGVFPGVVADNSRDARIAGELYAVDAATLHNLDVLEGHPQSYHRTSVLVAGSNAHVYLLPPSEGSHYRSIASGSWRTYCEAAKKK